MSGQPLEQHQNSDPDDEYPDLSKHPNITTYRRKNKYRDLSKHPNITTRRRKKRYRDLSRHPNITNRPPRSKNKLSRQQPPQQQQIICPNIEHKSFVENPSSSQVLPVSVFPDIFRYFHPVYFRRVFVAVRNFLSRRPDDGKAGGKDLEQSEVSPEATISSS